MREASIARAVPRPVTLACSQRHMTVAHPIRGEEPVSACRKPCLCGRWSSSDVASLTRKKQQAYRRKAG